jgi:endogenous inhibitor of DNA gyrase (YacG/DUF329 family)
MHRCPLCGRTSEPRATNEAAPFCSIRCKQIDLGKWLDEKYRIPVPGEALDEGEESETKA